MNTIFRKHNILPRVAAGLMAAALCFSLTGCEFFQQEKAPDIREMTPDDYEPNYYLSEEELPEDAFYIVSEQTVREKDKNGNMTERQETRYYSLLQAETNYTEKRTEVIGFEPGRITWVNYNMDEGLIPTMYPGDKMIYKSSTMIPTKYSLEKFFDDGYTLGVCGLFQDLSGNYKYVSKEHEGQGSTMSTSDAKGFDELEADSIYLAAVGDTRVSPLNVSTSGTVTGLELMQTYPCDIRTGTEKIAADLTCNIHTFSSAETYMFGSFTFITDIIAEINIPEYVSTGYYNLGNGGFFRFVAEGSTPDWHKLTTKDYNNTIYTYNEDGYVRGTTIGLIFDDNGFLVKNTALDENGDPTEQDPTFTYEDTVKNKENETVITRPTSRKVGPGGVYTGEYEIRDISEPVITGNAEIYEVEAVATDINEKIDFRYVRTAGKEKLSPGSKYTFTFREAGNNYNGYEILSVTSGKRHSLRDKNAEIDSEDISDEISTDTSEESSEISTEDSTEENKTLTEEISE